MNIQAQDFPFPFLQWESKRFIAGGAFSKVFKVKNSQNNKYYAVKQFNMKSDNPQDNLQMVENQIFVMNSLQSQYIVRLIDFNIGQYFSYIVMEFCQGDLKDLIAHNRSKIPESVCVKYLHNIIKGMNSLHQLDFVHRDIKPANILIKDGKCKLTDFGFATSYKHKQKHYFNDSCGTPVYMSPQVLNNQPFSSKCDIWSLGIVFYELLYGYPPWPMRKIQIYKKIVVKQKLSFPFGKKISQNSKDFIRRCLAIQQQDRINWDQIIQHPIFLSIQSKIKAQKQERQLSDEEQIVDPILKWMLDNIKEEVNNKHIDINKIFTNYQMIQSFNFKDFSLVLRQINPTITTHECDFLFKILDKDQSGAIQRKQFQVMFAEINHKNCNIIINREIRTIVAIIQTRSLSLNKLFSRIDKNQSGMLDLNEFLQFVSEILPHLQKQEQTMIFMDFDHDNSGFIQRSEFFKHLGFAIVKRYSQQQLAKARANRNLLNMKKHVEFSGMNAQQVMSKYDLNKNNKIQPVQMMNWLKKIRYVISGQQIIQIFNLIDKDNSGSIDFDELNNFFKQ